MGEVGVGRPNGGEGTGRGVVGVVGGVAKADEGEEVRSMEVETKGEEEVGLREESEGQAGEDEVEGEVGETGEEREEEVGLREESEGQEGEEKG